MYYSVTFTNTAGLKRNTWEDWRLIPSAPPMIAPCEPVYNYVDIPGKTDGPLDLTGALSDGRPVYKNASGSWQFYRDPDDMTKRSDLVRTIRNFLNGGKFLVSFEEDPGYYRLGRFFLSDVTTGKDGVKLTIKYEAEPKEYTAEDF